MSNIDKQALREVAERATPGNWRRTSSRFNGITVTPFSLCGKEVTLAHTVEKRDAEFIAAANPATMLALLDELEADKEQIKTLESRNRRLDGIIDAAEKRNAELQRSLDHRKFLLSSAYEVQRDFAEALGCAGDNESIMEAIDGLKQRIAELETRAVNLPKRSVGEVMHLSGFSWDYAEGWCAGNDNAIHEIRAAGIKVKES
ncbi:ead/Ea22-like family protein [Salmonella enterica]|nr:ead/Ea22-like family protein [Salmonella enterica subsp. enterica serovar Javiana]